MPLNWSTTTDWDGYQSQDSVVHESYGDLTSSQVQLGYATADAGSFPAPGWLYPYHAGGDGATCTEVVGAADGSYVNSPTEATDAIVGTTGVDLTASNAEYITYPEPFAHYNTSWTAMMWVQVDTLSSNTGDYQIFLKPKKANDTDWHLLLDNDTDEFGTIQFNDYSYTKTTTGVVPATGSWYCLGIVYDDSIPETRLYVDGVREATAGTPMTDRNNDGQWISSGDANGYAAAKYWDGRASHLLIWNQTLSDTEMQHAYEVTQSGSLTTGGKTA
jgi:hypothetical protein